MTIVFDTIIILVMFISIFMSFFRGFLKEFFTIISWVLATVITIYGAPVVQDMFDVEVGKKAFYDAVTVLLIFSMSMIVFSFVFSKIINHLRRVDGLFLDRSLGVLFGVIRGALLVCLGYIFIVGFIYTEKPDWMKGQTLKVVEFGAKELIKLNPKNVNWEKLAGNFETDLNLEDFMPDLKKDIKSSKEIKEIYEEEISGEGYSEKVRQQVEDLIKNDLLQE